MIKENILVNGKPIGVDRENKSLLGCVVMGTQFNLNNDFKFNEANIQEVISIGNSFTGKNRDKLYCYLGHSKAGVTSDDRLPFRIGYWENFRQDNDLVRADLILENTIDENPILKLRTNSSSMTDYVLSLAEEKAMEAGFSMSVYITGNEEKAIIEDLISIDLVENPALTLAMFSAKEDQELNTDMENQDPIIEETTTKEDFVDSSLEKATELFTLLDAKLKAKEDPTEAVQNLMDELSTLVPATEIKAKEDPTEAPMDSKLSAIEEKLLQMEEVITKMQEGMQNFSLRKTYGIKPIQVEETKEDPMVRYHELRKVNPVEAARFFQNNISNR